MNRSFCILYVVVFLLCGTYAIGQVSKQADNQPSDQTNSPTTEQVTSELVLQNEFSKHVQPILKDLCFACHGEDEQESGVRIDILDGSIADKQLFLLKHVQSQIAKEAMPPEDEPQPSAKQRAVVLKWIEQALQAGKRKVRPKNGSTRRLTVAQYRNALRDLLGVEDRLTDVLPADGVSKEGFRNNVATQVLTPQMLGTYFEIAEKALDVCLVDENSKPQIQCFRVDLGAGVNKNPTSDHVQLNGPRVLPRSDYWVHEVLPKKSFDFEPLAMQKQYRFIEGYRGNATVRKWKDFEGLHHSVFAAIIGRNTGGYNYGRSSHFAPQGLLLRPRTPETNTSRGPAPTFSMPMRELPSSGILQVTVEAARYDDGLQPQKPAIQSDQQLELGIANGAESNLAIPSPGVYQLDIVWNGRPAEDVVTADIGMRTFSRRIKPFPPTPDSNEQVVVPFVIARFYEGTFRMIVRCGDGKHLQNVRVTPVAEDSQSFHEFASFEKTVPYVSVHMGLRTDVGARLSPFAQPKPIGSPTIERYSFRAPVGDFASPDTETTNENYLAGLQEIGIRSEPTDDRQMPRVLVKGIEIEGPYYEAWPPKPHRDIFFETPNRDAPFEYAREVLQQFATRAYRRPPTEQELASLMEVWQSSYGQSSKFQESVRNALLVALTSPQFLYLNEESNTPEPEPLSPYELAEKLSFFLWNTLPDEKLNALATDGRLQDNLAEQVDRMIADDRFGQFADQFVSQWLSLDKFDVVNINFRSELRRELRKEPIHFVSHLIENNLPIRNLVDSDFIVANEVVANYYGLHTNTGYRFNAIPHATETLGGVLTQAAILSGLSDGKESNPVKRGAWVARKIVADPPEPPPPNVPELPEDDTEKTLRERLEQHRNQEGCAQCHQKIDPWGLPLEQFDARGLFKKKQVDASSLLPDKTTVTSTNELKQYLAEDHVDQVAYSFLMHLASYATGRTLSFNEQEYLKTAGREQLKASGYRMRDCVRFVAESPIFMEK